jgi:MoaA/NifB/PqqE/SkfB family radical SAM enzyme
MRMMDIPYLAGIAFRIIVLKKKIPLIANWKITDRCNYRCRYCSCGQNGNDKTELSTGDVFKIIDQLLSSGIKIIGFTGGEPFIRDDFGKIVEYCYMRSMSVSVNTNGSLITRHINQLRKLKRINLSLDGPRDINDYIRGNGSFDNVMRAIAIAREKNIRVVEVTTVLSNKNINYIDTLLRLAQELEVRINFQIATHFIYGSKEKNQLAPSESEIKKAVSFLLKVRPFNKYIGNSTAGLRYLLTYPEYKPMRCSQGMIVARIGGDGILYRCDSCLDTKNQKTRSILEIGFNKAWAELKPYICRTGCGCVKAVELNHIMRGNISTCLNAISLF